MMIELFAYQRSEGNLLDILDKELEKHKVAMHQMTPTEAYSRITGGDDRPLELLVSQITTAIGLIKGLASSLPQCSLKSRIVNLDGPLNV